MRTQHTHSGATPFTTAHPSVFGRLLPAALLFCLTGVAQQSSAQSTTPSVLPPPPQQTVKPGNSLDDDPRFQRLSPEEQDWVRKTMERLNKAVADKDLAAIDQIQQDVAKHQQPNPAVAPAPAPLPKKTAAPANAPAPNAQSGCDASLPKKPRFSITRAMQDAINKQARTLSDKTGIDVDPGAPAQTVNDAQGKPCPVVPNRAPNATPKATPKPAPKKATRPAKQ